ncbi:hypothetical protein [Clostridium sp. FP1]|uniref:hypothetical protein n=1 Tax=Clostridium sp. FP1 TaxID=2724076 RepID=UPI0013E95E00|nr:hypothetical protein [Clostridium sp. FP1]MBZ9633429.1 hypothetical protein [Clostridium sp. FP1]
MIQNKEHVKLDEVLKSLFSTSHKVLLEFLNSIFDENYCSEEVEILVGNGEFSLENSNYDFIRGDLFLNLLTNKETSANYHIEFQTKNDTTMAIRMFEYGFNKARELSNTNKNVFYFPKQLVIFVEENSNIEDELKLKIVFPNGKEVDYSVAVMKYWQYSDKELIQKKLYPLLPLQIFKFRKELDKVSRYKSNSQEKINIILEKAKQMAFLVAKEVKELNSNNEILDEDLHKMLLAVQNLIEYLNTNYGIDNKIEEEVSDMTKTLYDPVVAEAATKTAKIESALKVLNSLFGEIPQEYVEKISNATIETIDDIFVNLGKIKEIKEIEKFLH